MVLREGGLVALHDTLGHLGAAFRLERREQHLVGHGWALRNGWEGTGLVSGDGGVREERGGWPNITHSDMLAPRSDSRVVRSTWRSIVGTRVEEGTYSLGRRCGGRGAGGSSQPIRISWRRAKTRASRAAPGKMFLGGRMWLGGKVLMGCKVRMGGELRLDGSVLIAIVQQ